MTKSDPEQLVEVHRGRRTGQFAVINQAASWREQLQAGFEGGGTDWIKHGGDTAAAGISMDCFPHILNGSVDHVDGPRGANGTHPLTAGDADDFDLPIGKNGYEHPTNCASGPPHYGLAPCERPDTGETTGC